MKKNFALLGITILLAAQNVFAVDVHNLAGNGLETLSDTLSLRESRNAAWASEPLRYL